MAESASGALDLWAARSMMGLSLGFHIIFAAVGMTMPFFMAVSHWLYLKRGEARDLELTKMWSKGVAILFAVGAVSGTVLAFELGLLWPGFMKYAGPIIGMPFSWEGTAFFLEAIALGLFLYGWKRLKPWVHWWTGLLVGVFGFASGIFVLSANAWMNAPAGFEWVNGEAINIDPVKAMFNPAWFHQSLHMQLAALEAVGFAVAGLHAWLLWKDKGRDPIRRSLNRTAMRIALVFGACAALVQPFSGHISAQFVARNQPTKLAAMEAHFETRARAPLVIGGWPDEETGEVHYAIELPGFLSFLAFDDFNATVKGLNEFPREDWPPVLPTHLAFQVMVGIGSLLAAIGALSLFLMWRAKRKQSDEPRWFYGLLALCTPLGFIALEAGWIVTEVGRQPWIINGIMRTADAVTPKPGLIYHFVVFSIVYLLLSFVAIWLMRRQVLAAQMRVRKHVLTHERKAAKGVLE